MLFEIIHYSSRLNGRQIALKDADTAKDALQLCFKTPYAVELFIDDFTATGIHREQDGDWFSFEAHPVRVSSSLA